MSNAIFVWASPENEPNPDPRKEKGGQGKEMKGEGYREGRIVEAREEEDWRRWFISCFALVTLAALTASRPCRLGCASARYTAIHALHRHISRYWSWLSARGD